MGYYKVSSLSVNKRSYEVKITSKDSNWNGLGYVKESFVLGDKEEYEQYLFSVVDDILGGSLKLPRSNTWMKKVAYLVQNGMVDIDTDDVHYWCELPTGKVQRTKEVIEVLETPVSKLELTEWFIYIGTVGYIAVKKHCFVGNATQGKETKFFDKGYAQYWADRLNGKKEKADIAKAVVIKY